MRLSIQEISPGTTNYNDMNYGITYNKESEAGLL